jgi:hypothetical protein
MISLFAKSVGFRTEFHLGLVHTFNHARQVMAEKHERGHGAGIDSDAKHQIAGYSSLISTECETAKYAKMIGHKIKAVVAVENHGAILRH